MGVRQRLSDTSLGRKTFWVSLPLAVLPLLLFGFLSYNTARQALLQQVDEQLQSIMGDLSVLAQSTYRLSQDALIGELSTFRYLFNAQGSAEIIDGRMVLRSDEGDYLVNGNNRLVDEMLSMSGSQATVFQRIGDEAVRISTNVQTLDGKRAIGTVVSSPVYDAVINRGETFLGVADVVGTLYLTAYEPIRDSRGAIIGILFVGITESALFETMLPAITAMNFGETGHIHVFDDLGDPVVVSQDVPDSNSLNPSVLQEILSQREAASEAPLSVERDREIDDRVSWYTYIPELQWYLVAHVYPEEFLTPLGQVRTYLVYFLAGLATLVVAVSLYIGNSISLAAGRLVAITQDLQAGDLEHAEKQVAAIADRGRTSDEFAVVANAFRDAIESLRERDETLLANEQRLQGLVEELRQRERERDEQQRQLDERDAQLRVYFDNAIAGMAITSPEKGWVQVNAAITDMLGYSVAELNTMTWAELTHPDDLLRDQTQFDRVLRGEIDGYQLEKRFVRKNGDILPSLLAVSVMRRPGGDPDFFIAQILDLSELKEQEREVVRARDKLEAIARSTNAGIVSLDADNRIDYLSPRFTELFGYEIDDLQDSASWCTRAGGDEASQRLLSSVFASNPDDPNAAEKLPVNVEISILTRGGSRRNVLLSVKPSEGALVATLSDFSEQKRRQETIQYLSQHDSLTGLPNRSLFSDRLEWHVRQAKRSQWLLCVGFLDLDGFKEVNDQHGHQAGDHLLKETASRLQSTVRDVDLVARLGGDEFAIVFNQVTTREECVPLFQRILSVIQSPITYGDTTLQVSGSLGVTFFARDQEIDGDQLLRQADKAMYDAKLAGKNRFAVFDTDEDLSLRETHKDLSNIARAVQEDEFVLHYQPMVHMGSGEIIGAEALIRWVDSNSGILGPEAFLPVIYDHALSIEVGAWVLARAIEDLERLVRHEKRLRVSVNVFPRQFLAPEFVPDLQRQLDRFPAVDPHLIELELVETAAINDIEGVKRVMLACRELGIRCALDDFGTGYSSLSHLKHLPASKLKIDKSFIGDIPNDPDDLAIIQGTLSLARAFHRDVLAEGVETVAQGLELMKLGCFQAQGYAIARPMPLEEMMAWSDHWSPPEAWASR